LLSSYPTYGRYPYAILRADAFRYAVLLVEGGVYADMDVECLRPFDPLLETQSCVLTLEPTLHVGWHDRTELVSNAFMAAAPGQEFFAAVVAELPRRHFETGLHTDVLTSTGPLMLDDVVRGREWPDLAILPPAIVSPLTSSSAELTELRGHGPYADSVRNNVRVAGSYAIHYWSNSWVRTLAGELRNLAPHDIDGYTFQPGLDSVGNDIANGGRNIERLARACDERPDAVGFNTDGFLKHAIAPRQQWTAMPNPNGNEGLYVRQRRRRPSLRALRRSSARLSRRI